MNATLTTAANLLAAKAVNYGDPRSLATRTAVLQQAYQGSVAGRVFHTKDSCIFRLLAAVAAIENADRPVDVWAEIAAIAAEAAEVSAELKRSRQYEGITGGQTPIVNGQNRLSVAMAEVDKSA